MRYPNIGRGELRTLAVPDLQGGINTREGISAVADNQLTDAVNLWHYGGLLQTRPAFSFEGFYNFEDTSSDREIKKIDTDVIITRDGIKYRLFVICIENNFSEIAVNPFLVSATKRIAMPTFCVLNKDGIKMSAVQIFFTQYKDTVYCFFGSAGNKIYRYAEGASGWSEVIESEIYAPLVLTHCVPNGKDTETLEELTDAGAAMIDGYNLLGNYYRMIYSTVNKALLDDTHTTHPMKYSLVQKITTDMYGMTVTAEIIYTSGISETHTVVIDPKNLNFSNGFYMEQVENPDSETVYMGVKDYMLQFFKADPASDNGYSVETVTADYFVEDNMTITAPVVNTKENLAKVFTMRRNTWFGGAALGINGGTRLFLGGSSEKKERSLVIWSGLNNPLYFPENSYAYVGNSNSAVTAFGKQNDMLIIFKEDEIYGTQYTQANNITTENVINQNVIDIASSSVYFPMTLLHSGTGCDLPESVQLCRNRLVWADKSGTVYTLVTQNQYSERNVYIISEMIGRKLKNDTNLKDGEVKSADFLNRYFLFVNNHVYVMDYNSYGYIYSSSYSKAEDANIKIPWWYFELPQALGADNPIIAVCSVDNSLILPAARKVKDADTYRNIVEYYTVCADMDTDLVPDYTISGGIITAPLKAAYIPTMLQSKIFDFGTPQYNKNVYQVDLSLGDNDGNKIRVEYLTESSDSAEYDYITPLSFDKNAFSSRYIQNIQVRPDCRNNTRFGIRLSCSGGMAVNSIAINYRITGGAK